MKDRGRRRIAPAHRTANSTSLRRPARARLDFTGNQVRLIGRADPSGGKADVYLDGVKQLCGIDFWCPQARDQQVLCYKNGLAQGKHRLEIVALGTKNPVSTGTRVYLDAVQWSAAQGESGFGQGGGPTETQRVIFGYVGRKDYVDSAGPRLAAGNRVHHAAGHHGRPGARVLLDGAATQRGGRHAGPRALPLRRLRPRLHRVLHRGARADLSRAAEVLPGAKAARARRLCDQHRDCRQAGGHRHGHRRHGRRAGQGRRPGLQRHPAANMA